jgi:hypothetical protein
MTTGTTVAETCAEREGCIDIADAIVCEWSYTLTAKELALKQLSPATNSAKWIACNDERGRVGRHQIALSGADFLCERFGYTDVGDVRVLGAVSHLGRGRRAMPDRDGT